MPIGVFSFNLLLIRGKFEVYADLRLSFFHLLVGGLCARTMRIRRFLGIAPDPFALRITELPPSGVELSRPPFRDHVTVVKCALLPRSP